MPGPEDFTTPPILAEVYLSGSLVEPALDREAQEIIESKTYGGPVRGIYEELTAVNGVIKAMPYIHPQGGKRMGDF